MTPDVPSTFEADAIAMQDELVQGRGDRVGQLFSRAGAPVPHIVWQPKEIDLQHPVLRSFYRAATDATDADGATSLRLLDGAGFEAVRDWAMVLEPVGDGDDFRYEHYGSEIASAYRNDMSGRLTSEIGGHVALFFLALYRAVLARQEWVSSAHEPPRQVFVRVWRRLIVPLKDSAGKTTRIAAVNVADNELRAGLEALPDAVLVVDDENRVCVANRAARQMFGQPGMHAMGVPLADFTGLTLDLPETPQTLVRQGVLRTMQSVLVRNSLILPVRLTIGATFYRGQAFYVITAQPGDG